MLPGEHRRNQCFASMFADTYRHFGVQPSSQGTSKDRSEVQDLISTPVAVILYVGKRRVLSSGTCGAGSEQVRHQRLHLLTSV